MSAERIDGKAISLSLRESMKPRAAEFEKRYGRKIGLAVVKVGNDPASEVYVRNKIKACAEVGLKSFSYDLPEDTPEAALIKLIDTLNVDPAVDGILVGLARTGKEEGEGQIIRLIRRRIPVVMDRADRVFGVKGEIIDIKRHTGGRNRGDGGGGVQQRLKILTVREKSLDMLCVIRE